MASEGGNCWKAHKNGKGKTRKVQASLNKKCKDSLLTGLRENYIMFVCLINLENNGKHTICKQRHGQKTGNDKSCIVGKTKANNNNFTLYTVSWFCKCVGPMKRENKHSWT